MAQNQSRQIFDFSLNDAAAIGIIGGADGPTSIYVASKLAPDLLHTRFLHQITKGKHTQ
jgi:Na+-transporting methylmalonyl-CoA/oxaloacetate decarboxylase beta subunit